MGAHTSMYGVSTILISSQLYTRSGTTLLKRLTFLRPVLLLRRHPPRRYQPCHFRLLPPFVARLLQPPPRLPLPSFEIKAEVRLLGSSGGLCRQLVRRSGSWGHGRRRRCKVQTGGRGAPPCLLFWERLLIHPLPEMNSAWTLQGQIRSQIRAQIKPRQSRRMTSLLQRVSIPMVWSRWFPPRRLTRWLRQSNILRRLLSWTG